jgi:hypothetical protein
MATTPEQHFAQSFQADAENVFMQTDSRLWNATAHTPMNVESDFRNYVGVLDDDDEETAVHLGDTVWSELPHLRRRLTLVDWDKAVPIDPVDAKKMNYDPTNRYVMALRSYFAKKLDRKILRRMLGTAYTGKAGATEVNVYDADESRVMQGDGTFATAGSDAAGTTDTVLTVTKLIDLGAMMSDNFVPEEDRFIAVDKWQIGVLLKDTTFGAEEIKALRDIQRAKMGPFMGFTFVVLPSSQFAMNATDTTCFETACWHRSAVLVATGTGDFAPEVQIGPRADKKYAQQIFMRQYFDASRMQGAGLIKVLLKKVTTVA